MTFRSVLASMSTSGEYPSWGACVSELCTLSLGSVQMCAPNAHAPACNGCFAPCAAPLDLRRQLLFPASTASFRLSLGMRHADSALTAATCTGPSLGHLAAPRMVADWLLDLLHLHTSSLCRNGVNEAMMKDVPYFCNSHLIALMTVAATTIIPNPPAFNAALLPPPPTAIRNVMSENDLAQARLLVAQVGHWGCPTAVWPSWCHTLKLQPAPAPAPAPAGVQSSSC